MKTIFKHHQEYDGTLDFNISENNFVSMWIDTTDCDGESTITIRMPVDKVRTLQKALSNWLTTIPEEQL
jgi:hypothetical protein